MANPTKVEALYDRLNASWARLPLIRNSGRRQALPFIVVILAVYWFLGVGLSKAIDYFGADWSQSAKAAVFVGAFITSLFVLLFIAMVRSAQRKAQENLQTPRPPSGGNLDNS